MLDFIAGELIFEAPVGIGWCVLKALSFGRYRSQEPHGRWLEGAVGIAVIIGAVPAVLCLSHPISNQQSAISNLYFGLPLKPCASIGIDIACASRIATPKSVFLSGPPNATLIKLRGAGIVPSSLPSGLITDTAPPPVE
jgi:hypothetical protein